MRTSKKLLSLFLAVVMVVTTCSVGFTAFAQNNVNSIWSTECEADDAFTALDTLANDYLPGLLMGIDAVSGPIYSKFAKEMGKDVADLTEEDKAEILKKVSVQNVLEALTPTLIGALATTSKFDFVEFIEAGDAYVTEEYLKHYNYLDLEEGQSGIDFYTLYMLCNDYKNNPDLSSETRDVLAQWQEKLDPLAKMYKELRNSKATTAARIRAIAKQASADYATLNLAQLSSLTYDVTEEDKITLSQAYSIANEYYEPYIKYIPEDLLKVNDQGKQVLINDIPTLLFYGTDYNGAAYGRAGESYLNILRDYNLITIGEGKITGANAAKSEPAITSNDITPKNFLTELASWYTEDMAAADLGTTDPAVVKSEVQAKLIEKYYDKAILSGVKDYEIQGDNGFILEFTKNFESYSPYYNDMLSGILIQNGVYTDRASIDAAVKAEFPARDDAKNLPMSEQTIIKFRDDIHSVGTSRGNRIDAKNNRLKMETLFKEGTVKVGTKTFTLTDYSDTDFTKVVDGNVVPTLSSEYYSVVIGADIDALDIVEARALNAQKAFGYLDAPGRTKFDYNPDTLNLVYDEAVSYCYSRFVADNVSADLIGTSPLTQHEEFRIDTQIDILNAVKNYEKANSTSSGDMEVELAPEDKYNPNDYDFTEIGVEIANLLLNDKVVTLLQQNIMGDTTIEDMVNGLTTTNVNLVVAIQDVFQRLYDAPVATLFELLPVLTVLLDEVGIPLLFNSKGDVYNGLLTGALSIVRDLLGLPEFTLEAGTYIGVNQVGWDLNTLIPTVLHWLLRDKDDTYFTFYEAKTMNRQKFNPDNNNYGYHDDVILGSQIAAADLDHYVIFDNTPEKNVLSVKDGVYSYKDKSNENLSVVLSDDLDTQFTYQMTYEGNVPYITGIYIADKALRDAKISDLDGLMTTGGMAADVAAGLEEIVTQVAINFTGAVDEFVSTPALRNQARYGESDKQHTLQTGLNNIFVAVPQLFDVMENQAAGKHGIDKNEWVYCYDGKIQTADDNTVYNNVLQEFKNFATSTAADRSVDILDNFMGIFVEDWLNAIVSLVNNVVATDNKISTELPIVFGLLNALGGFGEESIITELVNGVFQLNRHDEKYSFTFEERDNGFTGLSKDNAYFLITNIPTIVTVINNLSAHFSAGNTASDNASGASLAKLAGKLAASNSKAKAAPNAKSASGYTEEELSNVTDLINNLDNMLSSLLSDSTINGFKVDSADNISAGLISVASKYLGRDSANDILKLVNNYLYLVNGGSDGLTNENTPDENGNVDAKKVYTNDSLTTIVVQTFVLFEEIAEKLLVNFNDQYNIGNDQKANYNLLTEAIEGIISPDTVQVRLGDYKDAQDKFKDLDCWHDAVRNSANGDFNTNLSINWGIKDGDRDAFFKGLTASLRLVSSILGVLFIDTNWYETIIMPLLDALCAPNGIKVDTADEYAALTNGYHDEAILGLMNPITGLLNAMLAKPTTTLLNSVKGLAGILDDNNGATIASIVSGAINPIANEIYGVGDILGPDVTNLSPTFKGIIDKFCTDKLAKLAEVENNALVNIKIGKTVTDADGNVTADYRLPLSGSNLIPIINTYLADLGIELAPIDWNALNKADSPADVLVSIAEYLINTLLDNENLDTIVDLILKAANADGTISNIVKQVVEAIKEEKLTAKDLLAILNKVLEATDNPTLVYWSFEKYLNELVEDFSYPAGVSKAMADDAVTGIDKVINNIFPLLKSLGVADLGDSISDLLGSAFTNATLTAAVKGAYGLFETTTVDFNGTPMSLTQVAKMAGMDLTTAGIAKILTDKSYGATYSSAANAIKAAGSWSKVSDNINWGFKDGAANAQQSFLNAFVAILRPTLPMFEFFLNEGTLKLGDTFYSVVNGITIPVTETVVKITDADNGDGTTTPVEMSLKYSMKNGVFTLAVKDANREYSATSTIKLDFNSLKDTLKDLKFEGTNGYNSTVIAVLEAFQCKNIKTYAQYQADAKAAKDNILLNVLNPILGGDSSSLINQLASKPVETLTTLLPNLAVFIDAHGLSQAVSNILAPVTEILYALTGTLNLNGVIEKVIGQPLGDIVGLLLGMKKGELVIDLTDLSTLNIEDIVIPVVNKVLASLAPTEDDYAAIENNTSLTAEEKAAEIAKLDSNKALSTLKFANINWNKLTSLGTRTEYTSKATGEDGKQLVGKKLTDVDYGKTLIVVLRYVLDNVKSNINVLETLVYGIDAIASDETLSAIVANVFDQIKSHSTDQIIAAIYYFFGGKTTQDFWDYRDYITKTFSFSYPDGVTEANVAELISFIDGIVGEIDLGQLLNDKVYTDSIINTLASAVYTDLGGVMLSDDISLADILTIIGIKLDTASVASMLKDKNYGETKQFASAANAIAKASDWSKVDFDSLKWGVKDKDTFLTALAAILRPIDGLLDALLADGNLHILEGIKIPGSNAYENSVVPLLEAFRCTGLKSYDEYLADKDKAYDNLLLNILNPLFGLIDEVIASPVDALASRLPNIALFIANDGIVQLLVNLITPVTAIIKDINPIIDVDRLLQDILGSDEVSLAHLEDALKEIISPDMIVPLINLLLIGTGIELPEINWFKLASLGTVKNEDSAVRCYGDRIVVDGNTNKVVITLLRYVLNTVLSNKEAIMDLIGNVDKTVQEILDMIFNLKADDLISVVFSLVNVTQSPTEVFWSYEHYKELNKKFKYPAGITAADADNAVVQLDNAVSGVFALLQGLGVVDAADLNGLVNDLLFTNEMVTKLASGLYGAIAGVKINDNTNLVSILAIAGIDTTPKGLAKLLMDTSYGATYSSAAKALNAKSSWKNVKNVNWGFKDGSAKAEQGFVNAVVAVLRPFINIVAPFLNGSGLELGGILYDVVTGLDIANDTLTLKNGVLTIADVKIDLANLETLKTLNIYGSNGYENAIVPFLDAFQIDNIKTYDQYVKDCKKAKDNVLLDVLNPVMSFVDDLLAAPFDTLTAVLPNVAYFIDNNGVGQLLGNLLSPVTEALKDMKKQGVDIDKILKLALGKDLGKVITDAIGVNGVKLNVTLTNLASCNIQEIVLPLINGLLKDTGIKLPEFKWSTIASHGKVVTSKSAAQNSQGKFTNKEVIADKGETLTAVLRYLAQTIVSNSKEIKTLLCNIEDIKKNDIISTIIKSVFNTISTSSADSIVLAIFYLLNAEPTNAFWDYTDYEFGKYEFSFPNNMDVEFVKNLPPMLDGLIGGLLPLNDTVSDALFKDELISKLATGLYGAVEGVKISDGTNLTQLLAQTGIDFSTANVAKLLTDKDYGQSFPNAASVIASAGSWKNVSVDSLKWGVKDRDSFFHALVAVLRPVYGVLDVLLNDASLGLFDIVRIPGSNGYTSSIVPLMEAFAMYNVKTQYQYRQDINEEYDAILLDIINPIWDKVEDILNAPLQTLMAVLPNLALFIGNDGLCQIVDNLFTPVSALADAIKPVVDLNDVLSSLLSSLNVDLAGTLAKVGIKNFTLDLYDLNKTLKQILGGDQIVPLLNGVLGVIDIGGTKIDLRLNPIDWLQLASHGETIIGASQAATYGSRIYVEGDSAETLVAVLRYLIDTVNTGGNYDALNSLVGGLLAGAGDQVAGIIGEVLGMLKGDTDEVISSLVDLLQTIA